LFSCPLITNSALTRNAKIPVLEYHTIKTYEAGEIYFHVILTSELGDEMSDQLHAPAGEITSGTHCIRGWGGGGVPRPV
jgi:hypothetical protein